MFETNRHECFWGLHCEKHHTNWNRVWSRPSKLYCEVPHDNWSKIIQLPKKVWRLTFTVQTSLIKISVKSHFPYKYHFIKCHDQLYIKSTLPYKCRPVCFPGSWSGRVWLPLILVWHRILVRPSLQLLWSTCEKAQSFMWCAISNVISLSLSLNTNPLLVFWKGAITLKPPVIFHITQVWC